MSKLGTGEDVANTVAFLASECSLIYYMVKQYMLMGVCIWLDKSF